MFQLEGTEGLEFLGVQGFFRSSLAFILVVGPCDCSRRSSVFASPNNPPDKSKKLRNLTTLVIRGWGKNISNC